MWSIDKSDQLLCLSQCNQGVQVVFQKNRRFLGGVEPFAFFSASSAADFQTVITSLVFSLTRVHPPCLKS